jgi:hypothetical protein
MKASATDKFRGNNKNLWKVKAFNKFMKKWMEIPNFMLNFTFSV